MPEDIACYENHFDIVLPVPADCSPARKPMSYMRLTVLYVHIGTLQLYVHEAAGDPDGLLDISDVAWNAIS
jgi:hypothetical protein